MKAPDYWKRYPVKTPPAAIERLLQVQTFSSGGRSWELLFLEARPEDPSLLISPGSAGHAYVFAELAYCLYARGGCNVFVMPGDPGSAITTLVQRHDDALRFIAGLRNERIGVFAEGLGGYAAFYEALAHGPMRSLICQNSPAILDEPAWREAQHRPVLLASARALAKIAPRFRLPVTTYLDFRGLVDSKPAARRIEAGLIDGYVHDPDFVWRYPLDAILSLVSTPPPRPLGDLTIPTMFVVPTRGIVPDYFRALFARLPEIPKRLVEVDGGVFWMVSHPHEAAELFGRWFEATLATPVPS